MDRFHSIIIHIIIHIAVLAEVITEVVFYAKFLFVTAASEAMTPSQYRDN